MNKSIDKRFDTCYNIINNTKGEMFMTKTTKIVMGIFMVCVLGLAGLGGYLGVELAVTVDAKLKEEETNNVGNRLTYEYEITSIKGDEVNGVPITRESEDNKGIFLYKSEIGFDVKVGDKIAVVWGDYEDEFASITKVK